MRYGLLATIIEDEQAVSRLREEAGCFVMITNVPKEGENSYDSKKIIKAYKDQYGIEQNFGFLKDPVIVNSIYADDQISKNYDHKNWREPKT